MSKIVIDTETDIVAEVYYEEPGYLYIKVGIPSMDFWTNTWKASVSKFAGTGLYLQKPKFMYKGKWISHLEFGKTSPLGRAFRQAALAAAEKHGGLGGGGHGKTEDVVIDDFDPEEPINLDDIPF